MVEESDNTRGDEPVHKLDFVGMDKVQALSADAFLVGKGEDNFSVLFFQNEVPEINQGVLGGTVRQLQTTRTRCVGRFTLSPTAFVKFLTSLVEQSDFVLAPRNRENQ